MIELVNTDCAWGEALERTGEDTATYMKECPYPQCEMCKQFTKGVCNVPIVVSKQNWLILTEKITHLEKLATDTEKTLYDEILGVNKGYGLNGADVYVNPTADKKPYFTWETEK